MNKIYFYFYKWTTEKEDDILTHTIACEVLNSRKFQSFMHYLQRKYYLKNQAQHSMLLVAELRRTPKSVLSTFVFMLWVAVVSLWKVLDVFLFQPFCAPHPHLPST